MKSHAATLSRDKIARQNRRCDMALTLTVTAAQYSLFSSFSTIAGTMVVIESSNYFLELRNNFLKFQESKVKARQ